MSPRGLKILISFKLNDKLIYKKIRLENDKLNVILIISQQKKNKKKRCHSHRDTPKKKEALIAWSVSN